MRALLLLLVCGSCTPYDPSLPAAPFYCGTTDPKCPDGYTCVVSTTGGKSVCTTGSLPGIDGGIPPGGCTAFTGALATWSLGSEPGSQPSSASTSSATGVTAGSLSRAPGLTAAAGTGSINASGWPTSSSVDPTKYFTLSVTPPSGCTLAVTALSIDAKASGTGPASGAVATSDDSFAASSPMMTSTPDTVSLSVAHASGMIELRIYGFAATAATGTMRVQNDLIVNGSLTP